MDFGWMRDPLTTALSNMAMPPCKLIEIDALAGRRQMLAWQWTWKPHGQWG